jgi:hypothetical protein
MEFELCQTAVYATEIDRIQKEKEVASVIDAMIEAALLEVEKNLMPKCHICKGDPMKYPPIFVPKTCGHPICCWICVNTDGLNEILKHKCPICEKQFTDDDVWWPFRDPNYHWSDSDTD